MIHVDASLLQPFTSCAVRVTCWPTCPLTCIYRSGNPSHTATQPLYLTYMLSTVGCPYPTPYPFMRANMPTMQDVIGGLGYIACLVTASYPSSRYLGIANVPAYGGRGCIIQLHYPLVVGW